MKIKMRRSAQFTVFSKIAKPKPQVLEKAINQILNLGKVSICCATTLTIVDISALIEHYQSRTWTAR
jgi:hypothetical protein